MKGISSSLSIRCFKFNSLSLLFEVDNIENYIEYFMLTPMKGVHSRASLVQISYRPKQGIHLLAKYDYFNRNYDVDDGSMPDRAQLNKEERQKLIFHRQILPHAQNVQSILEEMQELKQIKDSETNLESELGKWQEKT